jgi:hypothetical protein
MVVTASSACSDTHDAAADDSGSDLNADASPGTDASVPYEEPKGCVPVQQDSVAVKLSDFRDDLPTVCDLMDEGDVAFTWIAPATGNYLFAKTTVRYESDRGATVWGFDPAISSNETSTGRLAIGQGACELQTLECAPGYVFENGGASYLPRWVTKGEALTLLLDGPTPRVSDDSESREMGPDSPYFYAGLSVTPIACPAIDVGSTVPQTFDVNNYGRRPIHLPSCRPRQNSGNAPAQESYDFTAPTDGRYAFTLTDIYGPDANDDIQLMLMDPECHEELACALSSEQTPSPRLEMDLMMGQHVTLVASETGNSDDDISTSLSIERMAD